MSKSKKVLSDQELHEQNKDEYIEYILKVIGMDYVGQQITNVVRYCLSDIFDGINYASNLLEQLVEIDKLPDVHHMTKEKRKRKIMEKRDNVNEIQWKLLKRLINEMKPGGGYVYQMIYNEKVKDLIRLFMINNNLQTNCMFKITNVEIYKNEFFMLDNERRLVIFVKGKSWVHVENDEKHKDLFYKLMSGKFEITQDF